MLVAQNSLGPVCPVPLTVRGTADDQIPGDRKTTGPLLARAAVFSGSSKSWQAVGFFSQVGFSQERKLRFAFSLGCKTPVVSSAEASEDASKSTKQKSSAAAAAKEKDTLLHRPLTTTATGPGQRPPQRRR